ncbi:hypothetical protein [Archangium violaceum]|uniref:Uncharacterized protein n=1 Tax=Archangium violaceum Cb vi76 TaxID=1406225 RepID=A0A084SGG8_9BACT|nr:hypothetical protein [Archangium violaceum]KFA87553.1 hypothetical protein Q664_46865 [Archangium violaceum Cb vi76]
MSATLLFLRGAAAEWYLMFGGVGLAAVPLFLGAAMLRHEAKLREQYREVSREVANLERLDLALEYARIESEAGSTHAKALDQVVTQLLALPPASSGTNALPPAALSGKSEVRESDSESDAAIVKVLEATLNALSTKKGL